jgi:hypothetical protein
MPYEVIELGSDTPAPDSEPSDRSDQPNPFLQFVDPAGYRQMVERALGKAEPGRLITPLSRVRQRKADSAGLGSAWDDDLADDAA